MRTFFPCVVLLFALFSCGQEPAGQAEAWQAMQRARLALAEAKLGSANEELAAVDRALQNSAVPRSFRARQRAIQLQRNLIFLRGNLALAQSEQKLGQAQAAFGKPQDWVDAVRLTRVAEAAWKAARGRARDWPAARRNVERAQNFRAEILQLAEAAGVDAEANSSQDNSLIEQAPPKQPDEGAPSAPPMPPPPSPERIDALLERMQNQEDKKRSERRAQPGLDSPAVERDW